MECILVLLAWFIQFAMPGLQLRGGVKGLPLAIASFPLWQVFILFPDVLDEPCRVASHDGHGRHVVRDDAVGADDGAVADAHAGQHGGIDANPHFVFDDDRFSIRGTAVVGIRVMVDGDEVEFRGNEYAIADGDSAAAEECASLLYPASFSYPYILA